MKRTRLKSDPEKQRAWQERSRRKQVEAQKRGAGLARSKRIKAKRRTADKDRARYRKAYGSVQRMHAIQALPCAACGALPSENHHLNPGRYGRVWQRVVPLCQHHHTAGPRSYHALGSAEAFDREHGTNLKALAERLAVELLP